MGIVRWCWKLWWMPPGFEEPATAPPTGSAWARPPAAVAWTGSTKLTGKPSKTSMSIHWSATPGNVYAAIPPGKQIRAEETLIQKRVEMAYRLGGPHQYSQAAAPVESLALQRPSRNETLGRGGRHRRQLNLARR